MEYDVTIGLEVHCEMKTNSKMFSSALNSYNTLKLDDAYPENEFIMDGICCEVWNLEDCENRKTDFGMSKSLNNENYRISSVYFGMPYG